MDFSTAGTVVQQSVVCYLTQLDIVEADVTQIPVEQEQRSCMSAAPAPQILLALPQHVSPN